MKTREELLGELLIILSAGITSILVTTLLAAISLRIYQSFEGRFAKRISKDVDKISMESWESKDS
jgi:hypothetical protein